MVDASNERAGGLKHKCYVTADKALKVETVNKHYNMRLDGWFWGKQVIGEMESLQIG